MCSVCLTQKHLRIWFIIKQSGRGSAVKAFATQARGLELGSSASTQMLGGHGSLQVILAQEGRETKDSPTANLSEDLVLVGPGFP